MRFYKELYISDELNDTADTVIDKLASDKQQWNLYVVALDFRKRSQLEVMNSMLFLQDDFSTEQLLIVGIARGKEQALELVRQISEEVYAVCGTLSIRDYILQRHKGTEM